MVMKLEVLECLAVASCCLSCYDVEKLREFEHLSIFDDIESSTEDVQNHLETIRYYSDAYLDISDNLFCLKLIKYLERNSLQNITRCTFSLLPNDESLNIVQKILAYLPKVYQVRILFQPSVETSPTPVLKEASKISHCSTCFKKLTIAFEKHDTKFPILFVLYNNFLLAQIIEFEVSDLLFDEEFVISFLESLTTSHIFTKHGKKLSLMCNSLFII